MKMEQEQQENCKEYIKEYKNTKTKSEQELLRNNLYLYMKDWLEIWTRSILFRWNKVTEDDRESIPYLSFEGFLFALDRYSNFEIPIPKHFFDYIRYYLLNYFASRGKIKLELEELKETLSLVSLPNNIAFEKMLTLYQVRELIPEEHLVVWDDAILSMSSAFKDQQRTRGKIGMGDTTYRALKKNYIIFIKYFLGYKD